MLPMRVLARAHSRTPPLHKIPTETRLVEQALRSDMPLLCTPKTNWLVWRFLLRLHGLALGGHDSGGQKCHNEEECQPAWMGHQQRSLLVYFKNILVVAL